MAADHKRQRKWRKRNPWCRFVEYARRRCSDPRHKMYSNYGGKGITCHIDSAAAKRLWERDGAAKMKRPSLDRIDPKGNYTEDNCRFLELSLNIALAHAAAATPSPEFT